MFAIVFYQGGQQSGEWRRAANVATQKEAVAKVAEIERAGRPGYWYRAEVLDAVGMPEGAPFWWDFATLRPKAAKADRAAAVAHARALRS
jgi:hypothetical protein